MASSSYDDVMTALREADAAGNVDDARQLAQIAARFGKVEEAPAESKFDPNTSNVRYQLGRAAKGIGGLLSLPAQGVEALSKAPLYVPGSMAARIAGLLMPSGEETARRISEGLGYDPKLKAPSRAAEIGGGVSEFAGAGAITGPGIVRAAAHKIPAIVAEIGSTIGGGVGSEVGGLPGAIAGSILGFKTPMLFSKSSALVEGAIPWLKSKAAVQAPKSLTQAIEAHPEAAKNVALAEQTTANLAGLGAPGFRPTLAGQTGSPGIVAREEQIAASSAEDLSRYTARQTENAALVQKAKETAFPGGGDIQRTAQNLTRSVTGKLELQLDNITRMRDRVAQQLANRPQQAMGDQLNALRDKAQEVARGIKTQKIEDVYATADKLKISEPMDDVLAVVREVGGSDKNIFQNMPPVYGKIINRYATKEPELTGRAIDPELMAAKAAETEPKPASFKELHSLWREANTQLGTAMRAGDSQAQYYIQQVRDALKSKLDKFEAGGFGEVTDKFRDFNNFYATKYAPAFKEGVGGKMGATNRYGELLKPEDVVSKFFTPSGLDDFNLIYGGNKEAQTALADGVVGLFRQAAVKGGKVDRRSAQTFIRANSEALDKLPDVKAILSKPVAATEALLEQGARVREKISDFNESTLAKIAKTENVDGLLDKAFTDRRTMMQLVTLGGQGGEAASKAVARGIADHVSVAAQKAKVDPLTFVTQNEKLLGPALNRLGPNHLNNLKTIAAAKTILGRTEIPSGVGANRIKDFLEEVTGTGAPSMISMGRATLITRQSSPIYMLSNILAKYGVKLRAGNEEKLMREAIYNPEVAALWAKAAKRVPFTMGDSNKLLNHFASAGLRIAATEEQP